MLKRIILIILFISAAYISHADSISSTELINNAKRYDGKTINYEGEVIGDIMKRGKCAWININDGQNAIGIWVNNILIGDIIYKGSYNSMGDRVEVIGIFHRACPEHGGDLDMHAQSIRKITAGGQIPEKLDSNKIKTAFILLSISMLLLLWDILTRKSP